MISLQLAFAIDILLQGCVRGLSHEDLLRLAERSTAASQFASAVVDRIRVPTGAALERVQRGDPLALASVVEVMYRDSSYLSALQSPTSLSSEADRYSIVKQDPQSCFYARRSPIHACRLAAESLLDPSKPFHHVLHYVKYHAVTRQFSLPLIVALRPALVAISARRT